MKQTRLFDADPLPLTRVPSPEARPRLQRACWRILERLRKGTASNSDLAGVGGWRFGARLKELRDAGYRITCEENKRTGLAVYTLEE